MVNFCTSLAIPKYLQAGGLLTSKPSFPNLKSEVQVGHDKFSFSRAEGEGDKASSSQD